MAQALLEMRETETEAGNFVYISNVFFSRTKIVLGVFHSFVESRNQLETIGLLDDVLSLLLQLYSLLFTSVLHYD